MQVVALKSNNYIKFCVFPINVWNFESRHTNYNAFITFTVIDYKKEKNYHFYNITVKACCKNYYNPLLSFLVCIIITMLLKKWCYY
jgi:hypothetical protein